MGISQPFQILKMDKVRGNIVVSRRVVLEETRAEARAELIDTLKEGSILEGVVKNITDYGAFIDLGGVDGLLHVTDISWKRINHPSEVLSVGQTVKVQVIKFNEDNQRISLGMKQLENDPWQAVADKFKVGETYKGKVTNITDYGAFVELEDGIEGLVHVSEMSWTRKNVHPGKIVSTSQEVEVKVLEVDPEKRRISLGIKQCMPNPWAAYVEEHPVGSVIEGKIKNITEFGLFVGLSDEIDGMIHLSDISWDKSGEEAVKDYVKGQDIQAKIIDVDVEKERISLGIKQLSENTLATALDGIKKGDVVKATVVSTEDKGVNVEVNGVAAMIKKADLSKEKANQNILRKITEEGQIITNLITTFPAKEIAKPEIFPSLLFYYGMLTITATRGSRLVLSIPNYNVRKQYYEFMLEEYQDKRHINLNNLMDLFDEMAYEGHWRETLEFIAHAYKENSSVRSAMEGERNIQGFFTAYLSVNAYYLMAPEMELSHGYCDLFLMPDLMRYEVKHSYILELKYLSVKDTEEKARTQWQEAVKQINEYAAAPRVWQLVQNTKLHCIIIQFRGWELERMEEV